MKIEEVVKVITVTVMTVLLFNTAHSREVNPESESAGMKHKDRSGLANVAIINFANLTGIKSYDWLKTNLPDAIYDSMKGTFEFNRIEPDKADSVAAIVTRKDGEILPDDIAFIAKYTGADIIILGNYTYSKKQNIIVFHSMIYHLSRKKITGNIENESKVDSTLFTAVDRVSEKIVKHISDIAVEDMKTAEREFASRALKEKKEAEMKEKQIQGKQDEEEVETVKIALKKARSDDTGYVYDSWYTLVAAGAVKGTGDFGSIDGYDGLNGFNGFIGAVNSYNSIVHFGADINIAFTREDSTEQNTSGFNYSQISINGFLGFNFMIVTDRIFLQPYATAGYAYQKIEDVDYVQTKSYYLNPVAGAGLRIPVRIWGIYVIPFAEYSRIVDQNYNFGMVNAGIGIGF